MKTTVFPDFGLKWDIIAHNKLSIQGNPTATNVIIRTDVQLLFDAIFIPVLLTVECVFPYIKRKFASGDPLVAGLECRPRPHFS